MYGDIALVVVLYWNSMGAINVGISNLVSSSGFSMTEAMRHTEK